MGEPFAEGASQLTVALWSPSTATTELGAAGASAGETALLDGDAADTPIAFVAVTVNEYEVPFVRPETTQVSPLLVQVKPPGVDVTV